MIPSCGLLQVCTALLKGYCLVLISICFVSSWSLHVQREHQHRLRYEPLQSPASQADVAMFRVQTLLMAEFQASAFTGLIFQVQLSLG